MTGNNKSYVKVEGIKKQMNECIDNAYDKGYKDGYNDGYEEAKKEISRELFVFVKKTSPDYDERAEAVCCNEEEMLPDLEKPTKDDNGVRPYIPREDDKKPKPCCAYCKNQCFDPNIGAHICDLKGDKMELDKVHIYRPISCAYFDWKEKEAEDLF